jgi:hypothetical protein
MAAVAQPDGPAISVAATSDCAPTDVAKKEEEDVAVAADATADVAKREEDVAVAADASVTAAAVEGAEPADAAADDAYNVAQATPAPAATPAMVDLESEDLIEDIVPVISYEDKKCQFSKDGRYILPKREQFPSIFCALRVTIRLEALPGPTEQNPAELSPVELEQLLCADELGLGGSVAHCEDSRNSSINGTSDSKAREITAALSAALPPGREVGSTLEVERMGVSVTIVGVTETCDDVDPNRITAISSCFREADEGADAIAFELPLVWVIQDPDFKAKSASIGLYPGSYWMGFLKSWGVVNEAEIFFRTVQHKNHEQLLHLVVQFKEREALRMCFAFLHDRYLAHPKLEQGVRPPWCKLICFQDFKTKAVASSKSTEKGARSAGRGKPKAGVPKARILAKAAPGTAAEAAAKSAAQAAAPRAQQGFAPMTPAPKYSGSPSAPSAKRPVVKAISKVPRPDRKAPPTAARMGANAEDDRPLSPAEVMDGLSGKQLEVFQMVMSRMERLDKENQELMQILLQMQGLLQQQQQRNARLNQQASGLPIPTLPGQAPGLAIPMPQLQGRIWRRVQEEGAAAEKRKADQMATSGAIQGSDPENAPWKSQRRRFKRARGNASAAATAPSGSAAAPAEAASGVAQGPGSLSASPMAPTSTVASGPGSLSGVAPGGGAPGLAAYHNALLGV